MFLTFIHPLCLGSEASVFQPDLLKDKVIVITGGGTGLGRSMGERFLQLGAQLAITSRCEPVLREAADQMMAAHGGEVFVQPCDVRDPDAVDAMFGAIWEHFGTIDVLVNNAAGNFTSPTERLSHPGLFSCRLDAQEGKSSPGLSRKAPGSCGNVLVSAEAHEANSDVT